MRFLKKAKPLAIAGVLAMLCASLQVHAQSFTGRVGSGQVYGNSGAQSAKPQSTTLTSLFDRAYCNTIGYLIVRTTGAWTCSKSIVANPVWWGADPTGAADSASALNSALAASSIVQFPAGKFKFLSSITYNLPSGIASVTITGAGQDNTILFWPSGNGMTINYQNQTNSVHIRDLSFTTGATSANTALALTQTGTVLGGANMAQSDLFRVTFRGDDGYQVTDFWSAAINATGISTLNVDTVFVAGPSGVNGNGIAYSGLPSQSAYAVVLNVEKSTFNNLTSGLVYGSFVQGVTVTATNFTGCTSGIVSATSETGFLAQLAVVNSQFGQFAAGNSILAQTVINQVLLQGNTFITTAGSFSSSAVFLSQAGDYTITGNIFTGSAGANSNGIVIGTQSAATGGTMSGNFIGGYHIGILLQAAQNTALISGNQFIANTVNISNSGTSNFIVNNPGYNPVGLTAGTSTGTSASTITAGPSPETHYITQSATFNAAVKSGATTLCTVAAATVPCVIDLGPNESYSVTWATTQPTYSKFVH